MCTCIQVPVPYAGQIQSLNLCNQHDPTDWEPHVSRISFHIIIIPCEHTQASNLLSTIRHALMVRTMSWSPITADEDSGPTEKRPE